MKNNNEISQLCDEALASFDFGEGVTVIDTSGWEYMSSSPEITCPVFLHFEEDERDAESHLGTFSVTIVNDRVIQADCSCEGNLIGIPFSVKA